MLVKYTALKYNSGLFAATVGKITSKKSQTVFSQQHFLCYKTCCVLVKNTSCLGALQRWYVDGDSFLLYGCLDSKRKTVKASAHCGNVKWKQIPFSTRIGDPFIPAFYSYMSNSYRFLNTSHSVF